jgi:hypothetical protein
MEFIAGVWSMPFGAACADLAILAGRIRGVAHQGESFQHSLRACIGAVLVIEAHSGKTPLECEAFSHCYKTLEREGGWAWMPVQWESVGSAG